MKNATLATSGVLWKREASPVKILLHWAKVNSVILVNAGSLVGTTAVTSALGFVYWWLAARQFSPEAVGLASAAISAMTLLGTFGIVGLGTLLVGELPQQRGKEVSLICAALILVGGVGGVLGIVFAAVAPYLSADFQLLRASSENIALFALGVSLTAITLVLDQALIGLLRGGLQLWRNTLFAGVKLAALFVVSLWLSHVTGLTIYATWTIGNAYSLMALAGFAILKGRWPARHYLPQWALLRKLGPAALKHHVLNITLQAPALILPVLVTILLSASVNAGFYASWNLASVANVISAALTITLYAASSAQPAALARKMRLTLSLAFVACVLANAVLLLGTRQVLGLFGHSYAEQAAWSLRILAVESFPFIIKNHYIAVCRIHGRVAHAAQITIVTGILELTGAALGARLGGLTGLSLGWFAAMCTEAIFMSRTVYKTARFVKISPHVSSEQHSLEEQAIWLVDTLVLAAIRPDIVETATGIYESHLQQNRSMGYSNNRRLHLKPARLERLL
jgi:O-antigen/teichoic acid export membrane protein